MNPEPDAVVRALAAMCADANGDLLLPRNRFMRQLKNYLPIDHPLAEAIGRGYFTPVALAIRDVRDALRVEYGVYVRRVRNTTCKQGMLLTLVPPAKFGGAE